MFTLLYREGVSQARHFQIYCSSIDGVASNYPPYFLQMVFVALVLKVIYTQETEMGVTQHSHSIFTLLIYDKYFRTS